MYVCSSAQDYHILCILCGDQQYSTSDSYKKHFNRLNMRGSASNTGFVGLLEFCRESFVFLLYYVNIMRVAGGSTRS